MEEEKGDRVNRELIELLNELRVALLGVQVLFAFLLLVPFSERFGVLSPADLRVYVAAVLATAVASILFIAPAAHHRINFRQGNDLKEQVLRSANALAIAGTLGSGRGHGGRRIRDQLRPLLGHHCGVVAGVFAVATVVLWFVYPLWLRRSAVRREARELHAEQEPGSEAPVPVGRH